MTPHGEVIWVLKLAMNVAPVAMYFMVLGLVNSQSRVHLVSARHDWLALMGVFFPILLWPVLALAGGGWMTPAIAVLAGGIALLLLVAPRKRSGWVIYNCDRRRIANELAASLDAMGLDYQCRGSDIHIRNRPASVALSEFRLLRNVTITVRRAENEFIDALGTQLTERLARVDNEPSLSAAAMLVCGAAMLMIPLSIMVRHIDAFVKVFSDFIPV